MVELEEIMRVIAGPEEEDPRDEREGAPRHRLPRDGARDRRPRAAEHRPGPQGLDHQPRAGARLHDLAPDRGQVPDDRAELAEHDGDDASGRRRGGRLSADRWRLRDREGDRRPPADEGHAAWPCRRLDARVRPVRDAVRRVQREADFSDEIAREIDDEIRRVVEEAHQSARTILNERRERLEEISRILLEREAIDADEFVALIDSSASEEEVFGSSGGDEEPDETPAPIARTRPRGHGPRGPARCRRRDRASPVAPRRSHRRPAFGRASRG